MDTRFRIAIGDVVQTLSARCGTGGGNVPMIIEVHDDSDSQKILRCEDL
jgi:hypothetical protein